MKDQLGLTLFPLPVPESRPALPLTLTSAFNVAKLDLFNI